MKINLRSLKVAINSIFTYNNHFLHIFTRIKVAEYLHAGTPEKSLVVSPHLQPRN